MAVSCSAVMMKTNNMSWAEEKDEAERKSFGFFGKHHLIHLIGMMNKVLQPNSSVFIQPKPINFQIDYTLYE